MLRVVVDTNVLISALGWEGNERELMYRIFDKKIIFVTSLDILYEFKEVAARPKFGFTKEEIDEFTNALIEAALVVQPGEKLTASRDPEDNKFLEAALEGKADYIVSGDKDLSALGKFRNIRITTAAEILQKI